MQLPNNADGSSLQGLTRTAQEIINFLQRLRQDVSDNQKASVKVVRITENTTINDAVFQWNCNTDSAAVTITLPPGSEGQQFKIVNSGSSGNALTITPNGSDELIGVNSNFSLSDGESLIIAWDSTDGWY